MAKPNLVCSNPHEKQASGADTIKPQTAGPNQGIRIREKEVKLLELGLSVSLKGNKQV